MPVQYDFGESYWKNNKYYSVWFIHILNTLSY